jgi:hypothetical protein
MIILGIILSVFAIAFFCWLLFTLAVYALPFFVGMTAAFYAYHHGYGVLGAGIVASRSCALALRLFSPSRRRSPAITPHSGLHISASQPPR